MGPITALLPRARIVRIANDDYRIGEARLIDIADLQAWLDARHPDPLEGLRTRPEGMGLEDYERALGDAYDLAEKGPPVFGTPRGAAEFATAEGTIQLLKVALRHHHPELDAGDVVGLAVGTEDRPAMTHGEYAALRRAFFRKDPCEEAEDLLCFPRPEGGRPIPWAQAIMEVAELYGWRLADIYSMTVTELAAARTGGKPKVSGIPLSGGMTAAMAIGRQKRAFYGADWKGGTGDG